MNMHIICSSIIRVLRDGAVWLGVVRAVVLGSSIGGMGVGRLESATVGPGAVDSGYVPAARIREGFHAKTLDVRGRLVVGLGGSTYRLSTNGVLDSGFVAPDFVGGRVTALAAGPAETTYLAGVRTNELGRYTGGGLIRLLADGRVDTAFAAEEAFVPWVTTMMAVLPDGGVVVAGWDGATEFPSGLPRLERLDAAGRGDPVFRSNVRGVLGTQSGRIPRVHARAEGGVLTQLNGEVIELDPEGRKLVSYGDIRHLWMPWAEGGIYVMDLVRSSWGERRGFRLSRRLADGSVDPGWGRSYATDDDAYAMEFEVGGRLLVAGAFTTLDGWRQSRVARLNADGSLDTGYQAEIESGGGSHWASRARDHLQVYVTTLDVGKDGTVLAMGGFSSVEGLPFPGLVRLLGGEASLAPPILGSGPTLVEVQEGEVAKLGFGVRSAGPARVGWTRGGHALTGVDTPVLTLDPVRYGHSGEYRVSVTNEAGEVRSESLRLEVRFGAGQPGRVDLTFRSRPSGVAVETGQYWSLRGAVVIGDGVYVYGPRTVPSRLGFPSYDGHSSTNLARLRVDGRVDEGFVAFREALGLGEIDGVAGVHAMSGDRLLVRALIRPEGATVADERLLALRSDGSIDGGFRAGVIRRGVRPTWGPVATTVDGKVYLGGASLSLDQLESWSLVRLRSDGSVDSGFAPRPSGEATVTGIVPLVDGGCYVTLSTSVVGDRNIVERYGADGRVDPGFRFPTGWRVEIRSMAVDGLGRCLVAGEGVDADGRRLPRVMRLLADGGVDPSFDLRFARPEPETVSAEELRVQRDGRILVRFGGSLLDWPSVTRLEPDGREDTGFGFDVPEGVLVQGMGLDSLDRLMVVVQTSGSSRLYRVHTRDEMTLLEPAVASGRFVGLVRVRADRRYRVEAAMDAVRGPWETRWETWATGDGTVRFEDEATVDGARFYRVRTEGP